MRVLVTGSSGLLGAALAERLGRRHEVVGLDLRPGRWTSVLGAVGDQGLLERVLTGVDAVAHTASLHAPQVGRASREEFVAVNVQGTLRLLEAATARGVRRFVYTSSTSVYGESLLPRDRAVWVTEELPARPRDVYDVTKLAAEGLCADLHRETGLAVVCLRVGRFFPEQPVTVAINRLSRGLDLRDAVAAHELALADGAPGFGIYNISARSPFQEDDVVDLLTDAAGVIRWRLPWLEEAFAGRGWRLPERIDRVYVTARAERELGFRPVYDVASLFA